MSKGYSRKEEYPLKKGEKSRQGVDKRGYERQYTSSDDPGDKRPSVFDRLGSKGSGGFTDKKSSTSIDKPSGSGHKKSSRVTRTGRAERKETAHRRKGKTKKALRKLSSASSNESSSEGSSSSSVSSSTTMSTSSSTGTTTSSSSSVPSVKIRRKKQLKGTVEKSQKESRDDPRRNEKKDFRKPESERKEHQKIEYERLPRPLPIPPRPESAHKRKAPEDTRPPENWKQGRYVSPPMPHSYVSPRRKAPSPDPFHHRNRPLSREIIREPSRERIRLVPPAGPSGRQAPPPEPPPRYTTSKFEPKLRPEVRSYQSQMKNDFRIDERRGSRERLAPARPPLRDRIPPLLPESELRRPPKFIHQDHPPNRTGFLSTYQKPPPLLPESFRRETPFKPIPKLFLEKTEKTEETRNVKPQCEDWTNEKVVKKEEVKIKEKVLEEEEILSEISDDEPEILSQKEEVEVTSTLVDETGTVTGDDGRRESQAGDSILESMDFEAISEDELEDGVLGGKKTGIADALGVDWSVLFRGKEEIVSTPPKTRSSRVSSLARILQETGLPRHLVSDAIFTQVLNRCSEAETSEGSTQQITAQELEYPGIRKRRIANEKILHTLGLGMNFRTLSARRDLALRRHLLGLQPMPFDSCDYSASASIQPLGALSPSSQL